MYSAPSTPTQKKYDLVTLFNGTPRQLNESAAASKNLAPQSESDTGTRVLVNCHISYTSRLFGHLAGGHITYLERSNVGIRISADVPLIIL